MNNILINWDEETLAWLGLAWLEIINDDMTTRIA